MKVVLSYLKPYKWFALIALGLMLLELVAELAQPIIIVGLMLLSFVGLIATAVINTWIENQR